VHAVTVWYVWLENNDQLKLVCTFLCVYLYVSVCLSVSLHVSLYVYVSACLYVCQTVLAVVGWWTESVMVSTFISTSTRCGIPGNYLTLMHWILHSWLMTTYRYCYTRDVCLSVCLSVCLEQLPDSDTLDPSLMSHDDIQVILMIIIKVVKTVVYQNR